MIKIITLLAILGTDGGTNFDDTLKYGRVKCFVPLNLSPDADVYEKSTLKEVVFHSFSKNSYFKVVYFTTCNRNTGLCREVSSDSTFCYFEGN